MSPAIFMKASRPQFLTASILPVVLGSLLGSKASGTLELSLMGLAIIAIALLHLGANILNDVADDQNQTDCYNTGAHSPFSGGSRVIQQGHVSRKQMRRAGIFLTAASLVPGVILIFLKGWMVLAFGLIGAFSGWAYSFPPFKLASRGLGEIAVGLAFGLLPIIGASWLQSGLLLSSAWLIGSAVSLWIACVLIVNSLPDSSPDHRSGKQTLAVRLGQEKTRWLYLTLQLVASLHLVALGLIGNLPAWSIWGALPLSACAIFVFRKIPDMGPSVGQALRVIKMNLFIHAFGCLWLIAAVVLA